MRQVHACHRPDWVGSYKYLFPMPLKGDYWLRQFALVRKILEYSQEIPSHLITLFLDYSVNWPLDNCLGGYLIKVWIKVKITILLYLLAAHNSVLVANLPRLFVCQKYVAVQLCPLWWPTSNIFQLNLSFAHIATRDIYHKPVVPLTELGVVTAGGIRVCNTNKQTNKPYSFIDWHKREITPRTKTFLWGGEVGWPGWMWGEVGTLH